MFDVKRNGNVFLIAKCIIQIGLNEWRDKIFTITLGEYESVCNGHFVFDNIDKYIIYKIIFEEAYIWYLEVKRVHRVDNMRLEEGLYEL